MDSQIPLTPEWIRSLRFRMQLTQTEFAEVLGVSRRAVCSWEHGDNHPLRKNAVDLRRLATRQAKLEAKAGNPPIQVAGPRPERKPSKRAR